MTPFSLLPLLALLWHLPQAQSYSINPASCKGPQLKLLEKALAASFKMTRSAVAALTPTFRDDNVRRLFELLYGPGVNPTPLADTLNRILALQNRRMTPGGTSYADV